MKRHPPLWWAPVCRAESASANEFEKFPRGERKREGGETHTCRPVALGAWSWGLVSFLLTVLRVDFI